jgi:hypothetical protein
MLQFPISLNLEIAMVINESHFDRIMRIVSGLVLVIAATTGFIGMWGWVGLIPLITGITGVCPLYKLFGLSSCPIPKTD